MTLPSVSRIDLLPVWTATVDWPLWQRFAPSRALLALERLWHVAAFPSPPVPEPVAPWLHVLFAPSHEPELVPISPSLPLPWLPCRLLPAIAKLLLVSSSTLLLVSALPHAFEFPLAPSPNHSRHLTASVVLWVAELIEALLGMEEE